MRGRALVQVMFGCGLAGVVAVACDPPAPKARALPEEKERTVAPGEEPSSRPTETRSQPAEDAGADRADASVDGSTDAAVTKLAYGAPCARDTECSDGLCEKIRGALVCTKLCERDRDCPNNDDCEDNVCEAN